MSHNLHFFVQLLAQNGDLARVESEMSYLRVADTASRPMLALQFNYAEGAIAFARGDYSAALPRFRTADSLMPEVPARFMVGLTLLRLRDYAQAAAVMASLTIPHQLRRSSPLGGSGSYYRGIAMRSWRSTNRPPMPTSNSWNSGNWRCRFPFADRCPAAPGAAPASP